MKALIFSLLVLVLAGPATARDLSEAERASLHSQIEQFDVAFKANDFTTITGTVPPKVFQAIADKSGVTVEQLRSALTTQMQMLMMSVKFIDFNMDEKTIVVEQTASGEPYVLIPTRTLMERDGKKIEALSHTLGLIDGGQWYLLRVDDGTQIDILRDVYPDFAKAELPVGSMKEVE
ncbi:hypothetical protein RMR21_012200 [Agrobacterium sp. rho-8.1]|nr:hypothetical protein [Agrobacterium sp. rho-8.1]